jgi:hypothetical protein
MCSKAPAIAAYFVGLQTERRISSRVILAEGEELGSNILHLETPEIQQMRTTSAAPCAATARGTAVRGEEGSQKTPIISFDHLFSWLVGLRDRKMRDPQG